MNYIRRVNKRGEVEVLNKVRLMHAGFPIFSEGLSRLFERSGKVYIERRLHETEAGQFILEKAQDIEIHIEQSVFTQNYLVAINGFMKETDYSIFLLKFGIDWLPADFIQY